MTLATKRFFITYGKTGKITRYRLLSAAILVAKAQALRGRDSYVDQFNGRFTKTIRFFPRKKIREMIRDKRRGSLPKITRKDIKKIKRKK